MKETQGQRERAEILSRFEDFALL